MAQLLGRVLPQPQLHYGGGGKPMDPGQMVSVFFKIRVRIRGGGGRRKCVLLQPQLQFGGSGALRVNETKPNQINPNQTNQTNSNPCAPLQGSWRTRLPLLQPAHLTSWAVVVFKDCGQLDTSSPAAGTSTSASGAGVAGFLQDLKEALAEAGVLQRSGGTRMPPIVWAGDQKGRSAEEVRQAMESARQRAEEAFNR